MNRKSCKRRQKGDRARFFKRGNNKSIRSLPRIEAVEPRLLLSTYLVNNASDAASPGAGQMTLRQAIAAANANPGPDTINFDPSVFPAAGSQTIVLLGGQLTFSDTSGATTVSGPGANNLVVNGNNTFRVFNINAGVSASISGLTAARGFVHDGSFGGGIQSAGNLTLSDVNVTNNKVAGVVVAGVGSSGPGFGGGIYSTGTLSLQNCVVSYNVAHGAAFAGSNGTLAEPASGGGLFSTGPLTLNRCTVYNNTALSGTAGSLNDPHSSQARGGGIFCQGDLTLQSSVVTGNLVTDSPNLYHTVSFYYGSGGAAYGGGVFATGNVNVQASTISSNNATGASGTNIGSSQYIGQPAAGGGIYSGGQVTISGSTISSNSANGGRRGVNSGRPGNAGDASGGGIYATGAITVSSTTFSANQAIGGKNIQSSAQRAGNARGGAFYSAANATLTASQLSGNTAAGGDGTSYYSVGGGGYGGGAFVAGALSIDTSTLSKNAASGGESYLTAGAAKGGAAYAGASLTLTTSTVSGNTANGGKGLYSDVAGGTADGGGLFSAGTLTASNSTLSSNAATGGAGTSARDGRSAAVGGAASGGASWSQASAQFTQCTIVANAIIGGPGGNAAKGEAGANGGNADGGGLHAQGALQLRDCTVTGNTATGGKGGDPYITSPSEPGGAAGIASGGGVSAVAIQPIFSNTIISADKAGNAFNDVAGTAQASSGFNLIGAGGGLTNGVNGNQVGVNNPKLSALGNYGGPTLTMRPAAGSPVIDAGSNARIPVGITGDQRNVPRIFGKTVDIGADEYNSLTLTGTVFNDINGDGVRQITDPGLAGWKVYVDLNNKGVLAAGDPVGVTNAQGNYTITVTPMVSRTFIIREVRQGNWIRTKPAGAYPLGYYTVSSTAGSVAKLDFGNSLPATVSGTVYNDANSNGKIDTGETGLANVRVYVDSNKDGKFESSELSALTNSSGAWSIAGLAPGTYVIRVVQPTGYKPTIPSNGALTVTLTSGQTLTAKLFGEHKIA